MDMQTAINIAKEAGFEVAEPLDPATFAYRTEVRDMCEANKCGLYDKRWTCPPACGTLEDLQERCSRFQNGVLIQSICRMEDEFDVEAMTDTMEENEKAMKKLAELLAQTGEETMPFGSDGCKTCKECTYPDAPCRFPDLAFPSLEACGLVVGDVCKANDVPYYYGKNTIAFSGGFLFNPRD